MTGDSNVPHVVDWDSEVQNLTSGHNELAGTDTFGVLSLVVR